MQALVVPRRSRITIPVQDSVLRQSRVAARIHARTGRIVAEQTQTFDDASVDGTTRTGIALSAGATSPAMVWRVAAGSTNDGGRVQIALANFTADDARVDVTTIVTDGKKLAPQTVRVPSHGVVNVDASQRVALDRDFAVTATARAVDGRRVPVVAQLLATWPPASASTGVASTIASTVTATRWVVTQPDVDANVTITVYNPGPDPVTAALLPASEVDRATGPTSEPELAIPAGGVRQISASRVSGRPVPVVVTTNHPVVVGYATTGRAGAAISSALPDLSHSPSGSGG